jgi:hypothetical protein
VLVAETFSFGDESDGHVVGNSGCPSCWSSEIVPHECGTEGCLEHDAWGDEDANGDYWLYHLGDLCRRP